MAERGRLKIKDIVQGTKLAPNTVSGIYNDKAARIDKDTLNKLCSFLKCDVSDLIEYVPD
jgi:putative transcriptional regulator